MIEITPEIALEESEIRMEFIRASGPGGQKVNKVATAVQLRFDVTNSPSLPEGVRQRLIKLAGKRMTAEGVLIIDARRFRSQEENRRDAIDRLTQLIRKASTPSKRRRPTRPSPGSIRRRLEEKRRRGEKKRARRTPDLED